MYRLVYSNEQEFKKLETGLKKINMLAYRKLLFSIYPNLREGILCNAKKRNELYGIKLKNLYEIDLPTDSLTEKVYSTKYQLIFQKNKHSIELIEIHPKKILLEHLKGNTINYKGVTIEKNDYKSHFKIDLLNMLK